jgi:hypothetical protein
MAALLSEGRLAKRVLGGLAPCVFVVTEGLGKVVLWSGRVLENPFKKDAWIDERGE